MTPPHAIESLSPKNTWGSKRKILKAELLVCGRISTDMLKLFEGASPAYIKGAPTLRCSGSDHTHSVTLSWQYPVFTKTFASECCNLMMENQSCWMTRVILWHA